jgi:acylphosphatase
MTANVVSRRIRVRGRVQGVFYRATAQAKARELGVHGHARNLADGSVEVLAHGSPQAVEAFTQWLWTGSPASRVTAVDVETHPTGAGQPAPDFTTG